MRGNPTLEAALAAPSLGALAPEPVLAASTAYYVVRRVQPTPDEGGDAAPRFELPFPAEPDLLELKTFVADVCRRSHHSGHARRQLSRVGRGASVSWGLFGRPRYLPGSLCFRARPMRPRHGEPDGCFLPTVELDPNRRAPRAVADRIANEVREDLEQPVRIPGSQRIPLHLHLEPIGATVELTDDLLDERSQIQVVSCQRDLPVIAKARRIEKLLDHSTHSPAVVENLLDGLVDVLVAASALQQLGGHVDAAQRIAKVMPEYGNVHLAHPLCFAQLHLLPCQRDEHVCLAA